MGILDSVERGLERAVNGAFARTFRSGVQAVEIASGLKRELDIGTVIVDRDRVLAPNHFVVRLASSDASRLTGQTNGTLERELIAVITKHAKRQGYQLPGEPDVELRVDDSLRTGVLEIDASQVESSVTWDAIIEVDGTQHHLRTGTTTLGRGSDADIRIGDTAASRAHLQFIWDGKAGIARDLGSTNGSKIAGQRFREAALSPGTTITIGQTALRFELVPRRAQHSAAPAARTTPADPQQRIAPPSSASTPSAAPNAARPAAPAPTRAPAPAPQQRRPQSPTADPAQQPSIDQDFWRGL